MEPRINRSVRGARHVVRRWLITLSAISLLAAGQLVAGVPQTVAAASKPSAASAASAALARRSQCPAFPKHDRNSQQAYAFMLRHYGCSVPSLDALIQARRQAQVLAAVSTTGASWTALGPQPIQSIQNSYGSDGPVTGRVTALAVNPNNSAQVWLGGADGGVWYSNNSGGQWQPKTDTQPALPDLSIGSIAIDPRNTQTVYVGTGEPNGSDSYWGQGILRTTDGGTNWDTDTKNNELPFGFNYFAGLSVDKIIVDYDQNNNPIILAAVCCHQNDVTLPSSTGNNGGV